MTKTRFIIFVLLALMLAAAARPSSSQGALSVIDEIRREHQWIKKHLHESSTMPSVASRAGQPFQAQVVGAALQTIDVQHYRLQIRFKPDAPSIAGTVTIEAETTAPTTTLNIDAFDNLTIDALTVDNIEHGFRRKNNRLTISFAEALPAAHKLTIVITYHGTPVIANNLGGGLLVANHGPDATTVMANLSEPYAASSWWPCIDDVRDKATSEVEITVPSSFVGTSNGRLTQVVNNGDQTATYFWREDYPLATYLISASASNYVEFEDTYTAMDGTTIPLTFYVYPEHLARAQEKFAVTRQAMQIFAPLFGEYPFINEKYGMVEFPWGGGMEHQTLTSLGSNIIGSQFSSGESVIAHELAHQWWGDLVTLRTWDDIWLNEGFASYAEVLFAERFEQLDPGMLMSLAYDDGKVSGDLGGTVTAENINDPFDDDGAVYDKGAWVLHMLRHLMGDDSFFAALRDYRQQFAFGNASTANFEQVCEAHYGNRLDWFFQQWVYAPGRPVYKMASDISQADAQGNYLVALTIKQTQSQTIPGRSDGVYIMPLDVMIHYADGTSETRIVTDDKRKQTFTLTVSKQPVNVGLDEGRWVLKKVK